jgi:hypothetical protein
MSRLENYQNAFETLRFTRDRGVLGMTLHTNDRPFVFDERPHCDFGHAFHLVADDPEHLIFILPATGDGSAATPISAAG